jgi:hypothetical protein
MRARKCTSIKLQSLSLTLGIFLYRFDKYPEDNASALYGREPPDFPDEYAQDFPDFDYTADIDMH